MIQKLFVFFMAAFSALTVNGQQEPPGERVIAFASDTQAPMWVETILLRSRQNKTATRLLFEDVARRQPASLFILGDVVNLGYSERQWKPIDRYLEHLRTKDIPVHAILGNHEVMGRAREGERKFQERFPNHSRTGFAEVIDSVAVILLNSNFNTLTRAENEQQVKWYRETLAAFDADSSVRCIITTCHHSPFTNSKIVKPSNEVQERFVPLYLASRKSQLFLSGHCHAFEHYRVKGKDFMVIGGGGGLNQPLRQGIGTLADLAQDYKPLFHYITVKRIDDRLHVSSVHIREDFTAFEEGQAFDINSQTEAAYTHLNHLPGSSTAGPAPSQKQ
ncbi:MAG TPA: metallophosphoesterase [Flavisolibacter sp.]